MPGGLVYPELSYELIGSSFKVFNSMGFGYQEKYYQRAYAEELRNKGIKFEREKEIVLVYNKKCIGKYFLDFLVEDKVIIELKIIPFIKHIHIKQVLEYLNVTNKKLAILIYFTKEGIKYKRVINPNLENY